MTYEMPKLMKLKWLIKTSTKNEYIINHFNFISYDLRNAKTPVCK